MFKCKTEFSCDICGCTHSTTKGKMTDCTSKQWFRTLLHQKGWKTIYGSYDVCRKCVEHYGIKHIRKMLIQKSKESEDNAR